MVYASEHELRHDAVTARAARTLREAEGDPQGWLETPEQRAERLQPAPVPRPARLATIAVACALGVASIVGLVLVVEGLR